MCAMVKKLDNYVGLYRLFLSVLGGWSSIFPALPRPALSYLEAEQAVDAPATPPWLMTSEGTVELISTVWPADVERDGTFLGTVLKNHEMLSHQSRSYMRVFFGCDILPPHQKSMQMAIDLHGCWKLPGAKFSLFMGGSGQYAGCPTHDWSVPQRYGGVQCWRDRPQTGASPTLVSCL